MTTSSSINAAASMTKNTFESLISQQHTDGFWPSSAKMGLAAFLKDGLTEDGAVRQALETETLNEGF